jgi:prepilin-type N-terminal cleavage/methylation domain-containing protein
MDQGRLNRIKRTDDKGFTLVELIVVLVILAILAAILVPALLGYIDRAKNQQLLLDGKNIMTAIQAEASSAYATDGDDTFHNWFHYRGGWNKISDRIAKISDTKGHALFCMRAKPAPASHFDHDAWTVYQIIYIGENTDVGAPLVYFNGSSWEAMNITERSGGDIWNIKEVQEITSNAKYKNGESIAVDGAKEWYSVR